MVRPDEPLTPLAMAVQAASSLRVEVPPRTRSDSPEGRDPRGECGFYPPIIAWDVVASLQIAIHSGESAVVAQGTVEELLLTGDRRQDEKG